MCFGFVFFLTQSSIFSKVGASNKRGAIQRSNNSMNFNLESISGMGMTFSFLLLPWIIVHILFAIGVYQDAIKLKRTELVGPLTWIIATLLGGVFIATAYWILNRSLLNSNADKIVRKTQTGLSQSDRDAV